jgi:pyruvate dehydrogenase E2 component (dihydrolipoyllysine-residue acetyltransferase)
MAEFTMPVLGADMDEGTLVEWLVKPGDQIQKGDVIAVVDTAKSAIEVESFHTGTIERLVTPVGETVPVGTVLATITEHGAEPAGKAARAGKEAPPGKTARRPRAPAKVPAPAAAPPTALPAPPRAPPPTVLPGPPSQLTATPLVRHEAEELGVDLATVHGTGRGGMITRADVEHAAAARRVRVTPLARRLATELGVDVGAVAGTGPGGAVRGRDVRRAAAAAVAGGAQVSAAAMKPAPSKPAAAKPASGKPSPARVLASPAERAERAERMRQAIARLMTRSKREIPHYYVSNTVDLGIALARLRERNRDLEVSARLVPAALLLRATALAARQVPQLNGYWTDDHFVPAAAVHLGVAISLRGGGLVTPAIHDAADLPPGELMAKLRDLVNRARAGRLRSSELTDATITVTNLGDQGVESVTGVIYPPQVALVGFGKIVERPWAVGGLLGVRPVVITTLAADHRATDGYTGARFLTTIAELLQRPEEL